MQTAIHSFILPGSSCAIRFGRMLTVCAAALVISLSTAGLSQAQVAVDMLASLERQDPIAVYREQLVRDRAESGNANAQHELAVLLTTARGTADDYAEAAIWLQRAAASGHSSAQYWLGNLYMQGAGVPRNSKLMIKWWSAAALQGVASAQYALATAYRDGRLVRRNLVLSRSWFNGTADGTELEAKAAPASNAAPMAKQKTAPAMASIVRKTRKQIEAEEARARAEEAKQRRFERYAKEGGLGGR